MNIFLQRVLKSETNLWIYEKKHNYVFRLKRTSRRVRNVTSNFFLHCGCLSFYNIFHNSLTLSTPFLRHPLIPKCFASLSPRTCTLFLLFTSLLLAAFRLSPSDPRRRGTAAEQEASDQSHALSTSVYVAGTRSTKKISWFCADNLDIRKCSLGIDCCNVFHGSFVLSRVSIAAEKKKVKKGFYDSWTEPTRYALKTEGKGDILLDIWNQS